MTTVIDLPLDNCEQNYGSIKQLVQDYAARSNLSSYADFFMQAAQQRINRKLRIRPMEKSFLVALDANSKADIPDDFLQIKNFFVFAYSDTVPADGTASVNLDSSKITQLRPVYVETEEGVYADWNRNRFNSQSSEFKIIRQGSQWLVRPSDSDYPNLGGVYYGRFDILCDDEDTNWLTQYAPDLLQRGGCLETALFLKKPEDIQYWKSLFDETLTEVGQEFSSSEQSGSSLRPRIPGVRASY